MISTGDELVEPGVEPGPGQIVDSNSYMLAAAVREAGADAVRIGPVPDDEATLEGALRDEAQRSDLILTSGGVSMGAYDTVKAVLTRLGGVDFVKVSMQPGMPQGSGRVGSTPIVTLPGNPVSSYVSFEVFVRPLIRRLLGHRDLHRPHIHAICAREFTSPGAKTQFARVSLRAEDGLLMAEPEGGQGSHIIGGLSRADGLAVIPVGTDRVRVGDELVVWTCAEGHRERGLHSSRRARLGPNGRRQRQGHHRAHGHCIRACLRIRRGHRPVARRRHA